MAIYTVCVLMLLLCYCPVSTESLSSCVTCCVMLASKLPEDDTFSVETCRSLIILYIFIIIVLSLVELQIINFLGYIYHCIQYVHFIYLQYILLCINACPQDGDLSLKHVGVFGCVVIRVDFV